MSELALQSRREREGGGSAANASRDGEQESERERVGNVLHIVAVRSDMDKEREGEWGRDMDRGPCPGAH